MSVLKKPEFILSGINTVAIIGVSVYFGKQISALQQKLNDLVQINIKLATELEAVKTQIPAAINTAEDIKVKTTNFAQQLAADHKVRSEAIDEKLKKFTMENSLLSSDILGIAKTLRDLGIDIELSTDGKENQSNISVGKNNTKSSKTLKNKKSREKKKNNDDDKPNDDGDSSSDDDHASSVRRRRRS
jgi:hypothetical protein